MKTSSSIVSGRNCQIPPPPSRRTPCGRFDMAMDINRLIEIEHAVIAPPQGVQDVVGVFGAEAREDDAGRVGLAVAVGVFEVQELGAVGHVGTAVAGLDAGGDQQPAGEDGRRVGPAVVVAILDDQHLVVGDLRPA